MKKFVEFHRRDSNDTIMINIDHIIDIWPTVDGEGGAVIALIDINNAMIVKEDYRVVKQMLIDYNLLF